MKSLASLLLLSLATVAPIHAQSNAITGTWSGTATVKGQQVPLTLQITGNSSNLQAALLNGPESSPATAATLTGNHLTLTFNYYATTLDATLVDGTLTGTFGLTAPLATRLPLTLRPDHRSGGTTDVWQQLNGEWEVAVRSAKGESAWQLRIEATRNQTPRAVIQRIDGDTGSLFGTYDPAAKTYQFSHFTAEGPLLYTLTPGPADTLLVTNLLNPKYTNLVARRPADARKQNLPTTTDPTQQTTIKDPAAPFHFSFPDLSGKLVSNTDSEFEGKVVIVAVGGSWCPNCHDEAPFLESLYTQFHSRGLEIVDLSFEEADQLQNPTRLHAFVDRYHLTYPVLLAGEPSQLNEKITQANDLNCWPTSFFLGRDGRVREIHAGFAGPANPPAHEQLKKDVTALVERLLAEPVPTQSARLLSLPSAVLSVVPQGNLRLPRTMNPAS